MNKKAFIPSLHHVAIIPDGNRRWAKERNLPTLKGHEAGFLRFKDIIQTSYDLGIEVLTIWGFSTENWNRSTEEVNYLMKIFEQTIDQNLETALENQARIIHLGRKDRFSKTLGKKISNAEEQTKNFTKHYFCIALDYGGRDELMRAIQKTYESGVRPENLSAEIFEKYLDTAPLPYPNPDLIIRTSGEERLSGFMPWQGVYSELVFVKEYFPDFSANKFKECLELYQKRKRRFGK